MLKTRIIPILTFNGFGLVKTKGFSQPRMVGNPVQAARVYNSRGVDELVFVDIFATNQKRKVNLKLISDVVKECYMPVAIGGGISNLQDINDLLKIGADKVIIKTQALINNGFIHQAVSFFGSQCISIAVDAVRDSVTGEYLVFNNLNLKMPLDEFISAMNNCEVGEFVLNSVAHDGMMAGFDFDLVNYVSALTKKPIIAVGGGGTLEHYRELFLNTPIEAVGSASIFHFTQYTPLDIKKEISKIGRPVRL